MGDDSLHRHDISDRGWARMEPHLPGRKGGWGGIAEDNRRFINAVLWILRTGAPWRDLPPEYGGWKNTHRRFCRWRDKGVRETPLLEMISEPNFEWLLIDASHAKVHPPRSRRAGRQPGHGPHKRGLNTKIHLAVDAHGMPLRAVVTEATRADCHEAEG